MENRGKIEVSDGKIVLPEPIIQHIQSFMTGKEAAQTTVLSKIWCSAWLTRPNLEFDQRIFSNLYAFHEYTEKAMQRYLELNLRIDSFKLFVDDSSLGKELIINAMKLKPVDFHFETPESSFVLLPLEVLESEKLLRLSLTGCKIDGKATWSSLESLSLSNVRTQGDIICDIISSCPLIEKLVLSTCFVKYQNPDSSGTITGCLSLDHSLINQHMFRRLKCLFLEKVKISSLFFSDFATRFPCLVDLTVLDCFCCNKILISSPTLELVTLSDHFTMLLRAKFDVPRLRKFEFSCRSSVPSLLIERASEECQVRIHIMWINFKTSWMLNLNKFLRNLSLPVHSLDLSIGHMVPDSIDFPEDDGFPKPVVEKLVLRIYAVSSSLFETLFWSFHPKSIFTLWMPKSAPRWKEDNSFLEKLCKTLVRDDEGSVNRCSSALRDLEKVCVRVFEDGSTKSRPQPWKMLLDASATPETKIGIICFALQWGISPSTTK